MLTITDLSKLYPPALRAVDNVSLTLPAGIAGAIIGGNGVGKSTLLRCAAGLMRPTQGNVSYGWDDSTPPMLSYLGEADYLYGDATVRENLTLTAKLAGCTTDDIPTVADAWGIAAWKDRQCNQLSRGQRRRVALARCWLVGRRLLLLDEPLVGLDREGVGQFHAAVQHFVEDGGSVLMAAQVAGDIVALLKKSWTMSNGKLTACG